jgi:IgA peptidase M64
MGTADGAVLGVTQIAGTAPRSRAFNLVLLAEGFTSAQQSAFDAACASFLTTLWNTPPFGEFAAAINVFRVNVASTDSGADDPAGAGGTGAVAQTYFDASFGGNSIRRLLVCNTTTALVVAATSVPEFTAVLLVVNSAVYGGSGGAVATFSLAAGAAEIALHELGHSAFGFADEYAYYAGGSETGRDQHPPIEPAEPNVTINRTRATLKWAWAVAPATAVPTMTNPACGQVDTRPSPVPPGTVGLFEGAHYYHCGAYRPEYSCKMQTLGVPFCRVCREVMASRLRPLLPPTQPLTTIDAPAANASVGQAFTVAGWAIDRAAPAGSGVDAIHVYAFPAGGGGPVFLGAATPTPRNDVGAAFGAQFASAGFTLDVAPATLAPGNYQIVVFARSTVTATFSSAVVAVTVLATATDPLMMIDVPLAGSIVAGTIEIAGWVFDRGAAAGTGVSTLHVWALPASGAAGTFLGVATYGLARPDVGALFGPRFTNVGFSLLVDVAGLAPGPYTVTVFALSTVTNTFSIARVVGVTR